MGRVRVRVRFMINVKLRVRVGPGLVVAYQTCDCNMTVKKTLTAVTHMKRPRGVFVVHSIMLHDRHIATELVTRHQHELDGKSRVLVVRHETIENNVNLRRVLVVAEMWQRIAITFVFKYAELHTAKQLTSQQRITLTQHSVIFYHFFRFYFYVYYLLCKLSC